MLVVVEPLSDVDDVGEDRDDGGEEAEDGAVGVCVEKGLEDEDV